MPCLFINSGAAHVQRWFWKSKKNMNAEEEELFLASAFILDIKSVFIVM